MLPVAARQVKPLDACGGYKTSRPGVTRPQRDATAPDFSVDPVGRVVVDEHFPAADGPGVGEG